MEEKKPQSKETEALRKRAEEKVGASYTRTPEIHSPEETQRLLHELRVHQIELEAQNEELRWAQTELEASRARYFDLYDLAPVGYLTLNEKGLILEVNLTAAHLFGSERNNLVRQPLTRYILPEDQDLYYQHRKQLNKSKTPGKLQLRMINKDGNLFWADISEALFDAGDKGSMSRVIISDITVHKQLERERERLILDLQKAVSEIRTLQGIIPICAGCKKIRNDKGIWDAAEKYIEEHSDVKFSHGMCNECLIKYYPEHYDMVQEEDGKNKDQSG